MTAPEVPEPLATLLIVALTLLGMLPMYRRVAELLLLGGVFLLGFQEAVAVASPVVTVFLLVNAIVIGVGLYDIVTDPGTLTA